MGVPLFLLGHIRADKDVEAFRKRLPAGIPG